MLRLAAVAVIGAVSAAAAAHAMLAFDHARSDAPLRPAEPAAQVAMAAPALGDPASVVKSADGHYWAEAQVDGHRCASWSTPAPAPWP